MVENPYFPNLGLVLLCSREYNEDRNFHCASHHDRIFHFHTIHGDNFLQSHKVLVPGTYKVRQSEALPLFCESLYVEKSEVW